MTELARVSGSATSTAAAESMVPYAASARAQVLAAINAAGIHGLTRDEIAERTGLIPNCVRPRVVELLRDGAICPSDEVRRTVTGRKAEVLVIVHADVVAQ